MTEKIVLNATPEEYLKYFPGMGLAPPAQSSSSTHGETVQALRMVGDAVGDMQAVWGFVPKWRTRADEPIYYAAGGTIARAWTCSVAFRNWRCIVPASRFTCQREVDGVNMRYTITRTGGGLMLLAGIFEPNPPQAVPSAATVALLTTAPNRMLSPHGLPLPLLLNQKQVLPWLRGRTNIDVVKSFIRPPGEHALTLTVTLDRAACAESPIQGDLQLA